jgi:hypothetical protein
VKNILILPGIKHKGSLLPFTLINENDILFLLLIYLSIKPKNQKSLMSNRPFLVSNWQLNNLISLLKFILK